MQQIVRFSLKQKVFYNLVFVLLTVTGFFSLFQLPAERYPDVNFGKVIVNTNFPGASPIEVETLVTKKLEEQIISVENIDWVSAISYPERSHIRIKFIDDADYSHLYTELRLKILNAIRELPDLIDPPEISMVTANEFVPVIIMNLVGDHSNRALSLIAKQIKARLEKTPEIKEIQIGGEYIREFHIHLDPNKLSQHGVSFNEVYDALRAVNISVPAGKFKGKSSNYLVKVDEKFHNREQVIKTIIRRDGDGSFIRLQNLISHADLDYRDPTFISSVNGKDVIGLKIIKTRNGNAIDIKESVLDTLKSFKQLLQRENIEVILTEDSTIKIKDGFHTLGLNMLAGMILVSIIIWYFMGIRNAGLITVGIPFSFMMTMILMYITGNSLNELSLFAFVLVTGIIVDDAIVVCENIFRHIQEGHSPYHAIINGTAEVGLPVISSTLTTVAAFLPMLIMTGPIGEFFAQIPIAVSFALLASLIECLLILPIHYLDFGPRKPERLAIHQEQENIILRICRTLTQHALKFTLKHRFFSVLGIFVLLIAAIAIMAASVSGKIGLINIKFFPDDYTVYYADLKGPPEMSIEQIDKKVRKMSRFIIADGPGYAKSATGFAGFYINDDYEPVYGNNYGTVMVTLPGKKQQDFDHPMSHLENMRNRLKKAFENDGITLTVHAQKDGPPVGKNISIRSVGTQYQAISGLADEILDFMKNNNNIAPWLIDLADSRGKPKRIYRFDIDQEKVNEYDLDSTQVTQLAGSVLDGRYAGKYRLNDEEIDLKLIISPEFIKTPFDALSIPVVEHASSPIKLGDVVKLRSYFKPGELHRYQGQRAINIKADIKPGAPISSSVVIADIDTFYQQIRDKYPDANLIYAGEHEDTQRSFISLSYAFVIAIMIMYIILASQFQSYIQPTIILSAITFSLIGVVFGKLLTQSLFTINSFIAVIGVAGVVVNDALILVDFMNKLYQSGKSRIEAIHRAIEVRLRPIVLTTLTTTLGLLPMALGFPEDSIVWGTMASTFVSGLAASTMLTLFIVPVLWDLIIERQEKKTKNPEK